MGIFRNLSFLYYGNKHFTKHGYQRAAASFDNSVMERSLAGKVCAVTGANSGLGLSLSHQLAKRGATLFMLCRNEARGAAAVQEVQQASGNQDVHLQVVDVSSLSSISSFTTQFLATGRPLHLLVNNAGVLLNERSKSVDGLDMSFATNTLGTLILTEQLLPALEQAGSSRVIFVSSGGMYTACLELEDFGNAQLKTWDGSTAYSLDKRRQVALAEHLAQLWAGKGIGVYSMHPGWADTEGVRTSIPGFHKAFADKLRSPEQGVDTIVWLALEDTSKLEAGAFYLDRAPQPKHLTWGGTAYSSDKPKLLYEKLLQLGRQQQQQAAE